MADLRSPPLLRVSGVSKGFGGVVALSELSFEVEAGTITSLIGPNGAGKTTAVNVISRVLDADTGSLEFGGRPIIGLHPAALPRMGLVRTFQHLRLFQRLTALDNVLLGIQWQPGERLSHAVFRPLATRRAVRAARRRAEEILDYLGLREVSGEVVGNLAYGHQKLLSLGRVLATDAKLLMLDEPCSGLYPDMVAKMLDLIRDQVRRGRTVLLIEHDMDVVFSISDWVIVLNEGRLLVSGKPGEIARDPQVQAVYLGKAAETRWH